jgi:hypothetical protein
MQPNSVTSRRLLAWVAVLLVGCEEGSTWENFTDPPDPVFLDTQLSCESGTLTVYALVESAVSVSNLVVERTDIDAAALDPLFPTLDVTANAGGLTRWELELAHDCAASFAATWTVHTVMETTAVVETAWPDVNLDSGALSPPHGSDIGGTEITIAGSEMAAVTEVLFGGEPATILGATETSLVVSTPPGTPGTVDVALQAGVTTVALPAAFTYWADQTGNVEGLTRTVLHAYDSRWYTIGSAYVTLDPYGPFVQHEVIVHEPMDPIFSFPNIYPAAGDCTTEATVEWSRLDVGSYIGMRNDELGPLALISNGEATPIYYYVEADVDPSVWDGQVFDLELIEATAFTPAMVIEGGAMIPQLPVTTSFDWQNEEATTWGEDLTLTWASTSAQRLYWKVYPTQGTTVLGSSVCMADASTGTLTIPWATIVSGVDEASVTGLYLELVLIEDELIPLVHDNSSFWSLAEFHYWVRMSVTAP